MYQPAAQASDFQPPDRFDTPRLLLRPIALHDADQIFAQYAADPLAARYVTFVPHQTVDTVRDFINLCIYNRENAIRYTWIIFRKDDNQLIGAIDLVPDAHKAGVGYIVGQKFWNQGYMTETLQTLVDWLLAQPKIHRVWAVCDTENIPSARVMEKVGMQKEGLLKRWLVHPNLGPDPRDCWCYAKVR